MRYHTNNIIHWREMLCTVLEVLEGEAYTVRFSDGATLKVDADLTSVPITPELLEKLGFLVVDDDLPTLIFHRWIITRMFDSIYWQILLNNQPLKESMYIHQIQNLYQAIEDEPLNFNN